MKKALVLLIALSLVVMGVFAGVATAEETEKTYVGFLEDASMHSIVLHLSDGTEVNLAMNLGDEPAKVLPEEAGLRLGERLAVKAGPSADDPEILEAKEINVLTCLAGNIAEYGKNGFSIDDGGVEHVFIVTDDTVTFPENGGMPGDLVEACYFDGGESETLYEVYMAQTIAGTVVSYADDELVLKGEDDAEITFDTTGATEYDALLDNPAGKAVTVTFFGEIDSECFQNPAHVYSVVAE